MPPDPCLDTSDPVVQLSTVAGALKASLRLRAASCAPGDPPANAPNGLKITPDGLWSPIGSSGQAGGIGHYVPGFGLGDPSYPEQDLTVDDPSNPSSSHLVFNLTNYDPCKSAHVAFWAYGEGRINVMPNTEVGIILNTRFYGTGTWAKPSRFICAHSGSAPVNMYWNTLDIPTVLGASLPPGGSVTYEVKYTFYKAGTLGGGFIDGFFSRLHFAMETE